MLTPDQLDVIVRWYNRNRSENADMNYWQRQYEQERQKRLNTKQKKRQLMRESDFLKLPKRITNEYEVSFKPFTRNYFERRTTWFYLKGKKYIGDQYAHYEYPRELLVRLTGVHWHNTNQKHYLFKYNEQGELVARAGLRQPESRFGLATFRERSKGDLK